MHPRYGSVTCPEDLAANENLLAESSFCCIIELAERIPRQKESKEPEGYKSTTAEHTIAEQLMDAGNRGGKESEKADFPGGEGYEHERN